MKKRKQVLSTLLVAAMLSTTLAGCGQTQQEAEKETQKSSEVEVSQSENSSEVEENALEEATIQLWFIGPGKQKDSDKVYEAFNELLQEYVPNTTVEFFVCTSGEYGGHFDRMLASGEGVDLAWVGYATKLDADMTDGNLLSMDDLLDQYGTGIVEALGEEVVDLHRFSDGNLYYLPSWQGLLSNRYGYYVPTEFAELAGENWLEDTQKVVTKWANEYESPEDLIAVMDQWDKYLGTLKDAGKLYSGLNNFFNGFWLPYNANYWFPQLQKTAYVSVQRGDESYTVVDTVDTDYFRTFTSCMADFYQKGYYKSDILTGGEMGQFITNADYNNNTAVVHAHNCFTEDDVAGYTNTAGVDISAIYIENAPTFSKEKATGMAIPYCADEPERAMMVLNAIYSVPELYHLIVYGIEGEHYTVNGDGTITTKYNGDPTAEDDYGTDKWVMGTCSNSLVTQTDIAGYYDRLKEAEGTALINPFINFVFDDANVAAQVAAVSAVDGEYKNRCIFGVEGENWESVLDQYIQERKAAGVDDIVAEYQKQLDAYMAANNIQ